MIILMRFIYSILTDFEVITSNFLRILFSILIVFLVGNAYVFAQNNTQINKLSKTTPINELSKNEDFINYELKDSGLFIQSIFQSLPNNYTHGEIEVVTNKINPLNSVKLSKELENYLLNRKPNRFVGIQKHKPIAYYTYSIIQKDSDGNLKKIVADKFELTNLSSEKKQLKNRAFAANSVLTSGSGKWYKIGVKNTGIYKIDYNFLVSLGINPDTVNPQNINIYGNSSGMLQESPGNNAPDDLIKNAIYIQGEGDGQFNTSDFIVFYAKAAYSWYYNSAYKRFLHINNYFSDSSFYFINISSTNTPKRIQTIANSAIPNYISTGYDDYIFHENDIKNFIKSGRNWVGEEFDIIDTRSFGFGFTNLKSTEKVKFFGSFASYTAGASNYSNFNLSIPEGGINRTISIPGIVTSAYQNACNTQLDTFSFYATSPSMNMNLSYSKYALDSKGWLDYFDVNTRCNYNLYPSSTILFRDVRSIGAGKITQFDVNSFASDVHIWNVTDATNAFDVSPVSVGSTWSFVQNTDSLLEFAAFSYNGLPEPNFIKEIVYQDLHSLSNKPFVIVTHPEFLEQAIALGNLHANKGMPNHVVTTEQVYNEFSSGMQDAAGIRNFIQMFYERAAGDPNLEPKYLLLFGDGSYDNKSVLGMRQNFIPTHQSFESFQLLTSYTSDDYYGFLDYGELVSNASSLLDIGVGRLTVKNKQEAEDVVNKITTYMNNTFGIETETCCDVGTKGTMGTWRNKIVLIADDEDAAAYVGDCENFYDKIQIQAKELEVTKIYLDATTQTSTPGGQRYFDAEALIRDNVQNGALLVNYVGHGGEIGWAAERILDVTTIKAWSNHPHYPVFVTATCEFSRFDDPYRTSAGEYVLLNSNGGAVSLLTTTRLVFSSANSALNSAFYDNVFDLINNEPKYLGEVIMTTKNAVPSINSRNFCLLGDPAIQLKLPYHIMKIDSVNGIPIGSFNDTLKALSHIRMSGHIEDYNGTILTDFNGIAYPKVYDKIKDLSTLHQDASSTTVNFEEWKNILFQGRSTVTNGKFNFSFVIPKDLNQMVDTGRFIGYANNDSIDGNGYNQKFVVGSMNLNAPLDNVGPEINVYLNDKNFANGGTTDTEPYLIVELNDENGINTVGTGIGHDITMVLDNESAKTVILNEKYVADKDSYKSGKIKYQMQDLTTGEHILKVKAFDVYNNSAEQEIKFIVSEASDMSLNHVFNYPNPFTTKTEFMFEHNQTCSVMDVQIQIFTISGKLVKTINEHVNSEGFRVSDIIWDGKDDFGDKLARGTYIYRLKAKSNNLFAEKIERLVILY